MSLRLRSTAYIHDSARHATFAIPVIEHDPVIITSYGATEPEGAVEISPVLLTFTILTCSPTTVKEAG